LFVAVKENPPGGELGWSSNKYFVGKGNSRRANPRGAKSKTGLI